MADHITDKAVTAAGRAFFVDTLDPGEWDDLTPATQERAANRMRAALAAALPVLNTTTDDAAPVAGGLPELDEFEGFFIANDDGYPDLRYSDSDDGNDEGEHVCSAEAGTALSELVRAARQHAASLRGEQGE